MKFTSLLLLALSLPGLANEPEPHGDPVLTEAAPGDHAEAAPGDHAEAAPGDHAEAAPGDHAEAAAGDHAEGAHHDVLHFTGDLDNDGTPNWLDADAGEGTYQLAPIAYHAINLVLFILLIVFGFGATIRDNVRARAVGIRANIEDAAKLRDEAAARHKALSGRLASLETEIAAIESRATEDGAREEKRIQERADALVRQVADTAGRQIADEADRARAALRREAVELAVELAEGVLTRSLKAEDQSRLAEQFLASVTPEGSHV